jgi:hypothetical protein
MKHNQIDKLYVDISFFKNLLDSDNVVVELESKSNLRLT